MSYIVAGLFFVFFLFLRRRTPEDEAAVRMFWSAGMILAGAALALAFLLDVYMATWWSWR